jgi:DNA-directed RNA polymerase subunit RPC12/RpoP
MKTLEEHNSDRWEAYARLNSNDPRPNGIKCPKCGSELWDSTPSIILCSNPPQKDTHCPSCGYRGYRIA